MNSITKLRIWFYRFRRNIYKFWKYPKGGWIFKIRFGLKKHLRVHAGDASVLFDTSTDLTKKFFFPAYQDGESLEPSVMSIFLEKIKKNSTFFDIGAFVGSYAIVASKFCALGSVHAFEMNPLMINELRKNARLNSLSNLNIVCAAIWDEDGKVICFDKTLDGDASTNSIREEVHVCSDHVTSIRIDGYCEQMKMKPDIVKIDVEGAEVRALKGMGNILNSVETLFLEIHPTWLRRYSNSMDELADILHQQEFTIQVVMNRRDKNDPMLLPVDDLLKLNENVMLICEKQFGEKGGG